MADFKSLGVFEFPRAESKNNADTFHWKKLGFPVAIKEYGSIDFVDFAAQEPYNIAVTCSSKVQIYSPVDNKVHTNLSKFKKTAYGGVFRRDGKLLVAGSEDGYLRLFEIKSSKPLRIFKGHTAATHRCDFTRDGVHVVSFSDDKSIGLWDIPTETRLLRLEEHKDYIRAGVVSQTLQDTFISGSYDHTVKMYDARTASCVLSVDHGAPVESVLMFPAGGVFLSAGGTSVKVWDPVAGRLLAEVVKHHKTITSLCFASDGRRLMSGSLDRHVKIYDVATYDVVHTLDYPSPILSVAASPEDKVVAVGMVDGLLSIRHRKPAKESEEEQKENRRNNTYYQYRFYGTDFKPAEDDVVVQESQQKMLRKYDKYLKRFESSRALDAVLKNYVQKIHPEVTISVISELIRRGSLKAAMAGREGKSLLQLLKFVTKYIGDPRFIRVLVDVAAMLIDLYGSKLGDPTTVKMFDVLQKSVLNQVVYMKECMEILGMFQTVHTLAHLDRTGATDDLPVPEFDS